MLRTIKDIIWVLITIAAIFIGIMVFDDRKYMFVSVVIAIVSCVMVYCAYERRNGGIRRMVIISVMVAMAVAGRCIFAPVPGFKPVMAMVIIAAVYLGAEAGFITGSLTALISDMFFGMGPWTPFEMCTLGLIGMIAGIPYIKKWLKDKVWIILYGTAAGAVYSAVMDVWTVLSIEGTFSIKRYRAAVITSMPFMLLYSVSNAVFLVILIKPIGSRLNRLNKKHCIF